MTSKELVKRTLEFRNTDGRVPRDLWTLPWATERYPDTMRRLNEDFGWDFTCVQPVYAQKEISTGDPYAVGESTDSWGCRFTNINPGAIGEVKTPLVRTDDWSDAGNVHIPEEWLTFDPQQVNAWCAGHNEKFLMTPTLARPFERLQFIRTTEELYVDLMDPPAGMLAFMEKMHDFYCRLIERWAQTDVDAISFMDDWGAQTDLLISPQMWDTYFRPMYRDYIDIAHRYGKKAFMHSDGHTLRIIPKLIDLGLDAMNAQLFCMGVENLRPFRGKITFWGEIDRQHLLPYGTLQQIDDAVQSVYDTLWQDGGCTAQCEFGPGGKPENVLRVYEKWQSLR